MRLFLSDSFFDKCMELPRSIQQKVRDFQKKFRQNTQSASIHLEPIYGRDSSLRSARIDQAYRAILGLISGDNYMLLYVDKHDDAYRWAQNKKLVWNEHTQACQIVPVAEEGEAPAPAAQPAVAATGASGQADASDREVASGQAAAGGQPTASDRPAPVAGLLDHVPDDALLKIGVPEELISLVRSFRDLNDFDAAEAKLPQDAYENLFAVLDGEPVEGVIAEVEAGKVKEGEDTLLSNNNRRRFIEITDDDDLARAMAEGMEKWQLFLHPSQSKLVYSHYKGTVKVSGSAGTGKTIAALHRLKYLCQAPEAKVLLTTYTRALLGNISELVKKLDLPKARYDLDNIDQVLLKVARDHNVLPEGVNVLDYSGDDRSVALWREVVSDNVSEFDEEFLYSEYIDVIVYHNNRELKDYLLQRRTGRTKSLTRKQRVEIWKLKEKYEELKRKRQVVDRLELFNLTASYLLQNDLHPYTNVIADEFQDFSNPELRFLRALVREGENDLFLAGDPYQRIYSNRRINFTDAGINIKGRRSQKLKVNYRTTEEIKKMAVAVVKGRKYDDLDGGEENNKGYVSLVHGERPTYKICADSSEEVEYVLRQIDACTAPDGTTEVDTAGLGTSLAGTAGSGTSLADATAGAVQLKDICIAARTRSLYKDIQDRLHQGGVAYKEIKKGGNRVGHADGLSLCTFHSLKGLEYKIVFLVGVNEKSMPSKETADFPFTTMDAAEKKEYLTGIRSLLYVAITRARQMVFISGYGEPTALLEADAS